MDNTNLGDYQQPYVNHPRSNPPYGFYAGEDFLHINIPPRERLMGDWLVSSSINIVFAKAGVGKSNFAIGLAMALVRGESFLDFPASEPRRVMYVDGEMPKEELHRRLKAMANGRPIPEGLYLFNMASAEPALQNPPLDTPEGQEAMMRMVDDAAPDVLILDNKSTLFGNQRENEAGSWDAPQRWLTRLRAEGLAIILLHHANKEGGQRGTSAIEVSPDAIIRLSEVGQPEESENTSQFILMFDKKRHFGGVKSAPRLITLNMECDTVVWSCKSIGRGVREPHPRLEEVLDLRKKGKSFDEISKLTGLSKTTTYNLVNMAGKK